MSTQRALSGWGVGRGEPGPAHFRGRAHQVPPPPGPQGLLFSRKYSSDQVQVKSSANNRGSLFGGEPCDPSPPLPHHRPPSPPPSSPPAALPPAAAGLVCRTGTSPDLQLSGSSWKLLLLTVRTCLLKTSDLISTRPDPSDADWPGGRGSLLPLLPEAASRSSGSVKGGEASEACFEQAS